MSNYDFRCSKYTCIKKGKETTKWRVEYAYKTPDGIYHKSCKRGFNKKEDGKAWAQTELPKLIAEKEQGEPPKPVAQQTNNQPSKEEMLFSELVARYIERAKLRRKETTCYTKTNIIDTWILPHFKDKKVFEITVEDIENWQDMLLQAKTQRGKPLAKTYISTIRSQFTAVMNYAVTIHNLPFNPLYKAEMIGEKDADEQPFWELEHYKAFRQIVAEKPTYFYAFEILFWTGMRLGELFALTPLHIDTEKKTIKIEHTYSVLQGRELLTSPKNQTSNRTVDIPETLALELREFIDGLYDLDDTTRIFQMLNKSGMHRELDRGTALCNLPEITLHGFRHSHISLCSSSKINAREAVIAERVGHSRKKSMTRKYTHVYPDDRKALVDKLNELMEEMDNVS